MKTISLIIPTYNEDGRIKKTLETLKKGVSFYGLNLREIIFSDDGSADDTVIMIKQYKKAIERKTKAKVKILVSKKNHGRGYVTTKAALKSKGDYAIYTDADFSIPLTNLRKFLPYLNQDYDLLFGSKKMPGAKEIIKRSFLRRVVGYGHSLIAYLVLGVSAWDFQGGFKIFSRSFVDNIFPHLKIERWGFDMEVIFLAKKLSYKTIELPVKWGHVENGSKVKLLRDIYRSLSEMFTIKSHWLKGEYQKSVSPRYGLKFYQTKYV